MSLDAEPAFRAEVRDWLAAHVPAAPLPSVDTAEGFERHREWERELAAARLAVVSWPAEYGGRDASLLDWLVFEEEYYAAGGPVRVGQNGLFLLAPTLFAHGTAEQRDRLLPPMARADEVWAQAWSEPEAGSDLAAIRARGARGPTGAGCCPGRRPGARGPRSPTGRSACSAPIPAAERHRGLTYLMFDLRAAGVTVRPIRQLGGETGFAEIFLDERVRAGRRRDRRARRRLAGRDEHGQPRARAVAAQPGPVPAPRPAGWPSCGSGPRTRPTPGCATGWPTPGSAPGPTSCTPRRRPQRLAAGGTLGAESSLGKVFWSELDVALHETALDLLGPRAERRDLPGEDGRWLDGYLFALAGPIYAGTNEIQRTVIAERLLGLPR